MDSKQKVRLSKVLIYENITALLIHYIVRTGYNGASREADYDEYMKRLGGGWKQLSI